MCSGSDVGTTTLGIQGAGTLMSTVASYQKSRADKAAYGFAAATADQNAALDALKASDARFRGDVSAQTAELKTAQLAGKQRAGMAASGVDLGTGSPNLILAGTEFMGERDAQIIKDNAMKEAWGFDVQAANDRSNAALFRFRAASERPGMNAATTLLTGAGSVASNWYNIRTTEGRRGYTGGA